MAPRVRRLHWENQALELQPQEYSWIEFHLDYVSVKVELVMETSELARLIVCMFRIV